MQNLELMAVLSLLASVYDPIPSCPVQFSSLLILSAARWHLVLLNDMLLHAEAYRQMILTVLRHQRSLNFCSPFFSLTQTCPPKRYTLELTAAAQ